MERIITLVAQDETEINIDPSTKITIRDTIVGEDAVYGTVYNEALIKDLNSDSGNREVTMKFTADYCEEVLKSTK